MIKPLLFHALVSRINFLSLHGKDKIREKLRARRNSLNESDTAYPIQISPDSQSIYKAALRTKKILFLQIGT